MAGHQEREQIESRERNGTMHQRPRPPHQSGKATTGRVDWPLKAAMAPQLEGYR
jgi:hypothetical protein